MRAITRRLLRRTASAGLLGVALMSSLGPAIAASPEGKSGTDAEARRWIEEMKTSERGPFARIRWFCNDGTLQPPVSYGCKEHGGGRQHGEWSERAKSLRSRGYLVANVLAAVEEDGRLPGGALEWALVEQYLLRVDDGWILRRARSYRGALQEEDERRGARRILLGILADPSRVEREYPVLRIAARLLSHGAENRSAARVRQLSADLAGRDPSFMTVRNKIHVTPSREDAATVRRHAESVLDPDLRAQYARLAADIDELYAPSEVAAELEALAARAGVTAGFAAHARAAAMRLRSASSASARYTETGLLLAAMRDEVAAANGPGVKLRVLDTSLEVEAEHYAAGAEVRGELPNLDRRARIALLRSGAAAVYGAGLGSRRQQAALARCMAQLDVGGSVGLDVYKRELDYLKVVPGWGSQRLRFHFADTVARFVDIEPKASLFVDDQLRGSPLFGFAEVLDSLVRDANRLAGVRNELFGENVGAGLRALNPGLARGRLLAASGDAADLASDGIYLLPETTSELPPVAGILTAGEGNPLSHVQLLARNLGIPNVAVDESLSPAIRARLGRRVILAVSPAGSVRLALDEGEGERIFGQERKAEDELLIRPDLEKLDLATRRPLRLAALRASDSGRSVGPKAAKLGELHHQFPGAVTDGIAIPFGVFRALLERRVAAGGPSAYEWMRSEYGRLAGLPAGSELRRTQTEKFRAALHDWVAAARLDPEFEARLREEMAAVFGADGSYGVFVRSDTNVEDLPGFTGAGLNLTVPNVVGVDAILSAIPRVWASPFTARAFAWRQSHMSGPEHVYPAVLLLRSVPVEKSGVMVTRHIETGESGWLSIAVNEGVGGAVDGQAAESLRVNAANRRVRLLAQATAPIRRRVNPAGGVDKLPVTGGDYVLTEPEIAKLVELAAVLPEKFPEIVDDEGRPAAADIEFGFLRGELELFQIRPFLESRQARGNAYLTALDAGLTDARSIRVPLSEVPR